MTLRDMEDFFSGGFEYLDGDVGSGDSRFQPPLIKVQKRVIHLVLLFSSFGAIIDEEFLVCFRNLSFPIQKLSAAGVRLQFGSGHWQCRIALPGLPMALQSDNSDAESEGPPGLITDNDKSEDEGAAFPAPAAAAAARAAAPSHRRRDVLPSRRERCKKSERMTRQRGFTFADHSTSRPRTFQGYGKSVKRQLQWLARPLADCVVIAGHVSLLWVSRCSVYMLMFVLCLIVRMFVRGRTHCGADGRSSERSGSIMRSRQKLEDGVVVHRPPFRSSSLRCALCTFMRCVHVSSCVESCGVIIITHCSCATSPPTPSSLQIRKTPLL